MAANHRRLIDLKIPEARQTYSAEDSMFYALSLGIGADPMDGRELAFVYEKDLQALPTMAVTLAHPGFWPRDLDTGLDWTKIVHAEHELVLHRPLQASASIIGRNRIIDVVDKGVGKGALVYWERTIFETGHEAPLCTMVQTMYCRGDGGIGGSTGPARAPHPIPARPPDAVCESATLPQLALLYRLNGDLNPLHADPEAARRAGFERPILHGLATFGIAGFAILKSMCDYDASRLASLSCRFTAPIFPGERLRTELWREGRVVSFTVAVVERGVIAVNHGRATLRSD